MSCPLATIGERLVYGSCFYVFEPVVWLLISGTILVEDTASEAIHPPNTDSSVSWEEVSTGTEHCWYPTET